MRPLLILSLSLFLLLACEPETTINDSLIPDNSLVGEWQMVEQKVSIGGPATWQKVENGTTFTLENDNTFRGFQLFSECATGSFEASEDELTLTHNCEENTEPFTYSFKLEKGDIILSPKSVICTETCEYKYRKTQ